MSYLPLQDGDPSRIGRYRLTGRLGSGGMGVVYLGEASDRTPVAVKVLRPELADDQQFRARFRREVAALARVDGLCTVRVIEADTESPRPFLVTEYASGPSLAEHVDEAGPMESAMLHGLAAGLAEALTAIHATGVVHRDLKPSNVLLTPAGPKVIDFGIAQALDATAVTRTGITVGSPGFMAPEQVTGRAGQEADIFAWGLTLAYAAKGEPPFGAGPAEVILYRIVHDSPDVSAVPAELQPLVQAALAREPGDRPTARDLLTQLTSEAAQEGNADDVPTQLVLSRTWLLPAGSAPQPDRRSRWNRSPVIASAVVLAAATAGVGVVLSSGGSGSAGTAAAGNTAPARPAAEKSSEAPTARPSASLTAAANRGAGQGQPTTTPTTATARLPSSSTASGNVSGSAENADSYVHRLGYAVVKNSPFWDPAAPLNIIVAAYAGGADGPMKAFFFGDGKFTGTDTPDGSGSESAMRVSGDEITVQYYIYATGDPLCCPTGGTEGVRFTWADGQLQTLDPIPPSEVRR